MLCLDAYHLWQCFLSLPTSFVVNSKLREKWEQHSPRLAERFVNRLVMLVRLKASRVAERNRGRGGGGVGMRAIHLVDWLYIWLNYDIHMIIWAHTNARTSVGSMTWCRASQPRIGWEISMFVCNSYMRGND